MTRIRNIAVGLLVRDGHVLAEEYPAAGGYHRFVRAIGGGIEFGERAEQALRREFAEELGVVLGRVEPLAVIENLFTMLDRPGHQIVHVFAVQCTELEVMPRGQRRPVLDTHTTVGWFALRDLARAEPPFYPDGVLDHALRLETHRFAR